MANIDSHDDLNCPTCGYLLTGTIETTCPECGNAFDPKHLRGLNRKYSGVIEIPPYVVAIGFLLISSLLLGFSMYSISNSRMTGGVWRWSILLGLYMLYKSISLCRRRW